MNKAEKAAAYLNATTTSPLGDVAHTEVNISRSSSKPFDLVTTLHVMLDVYTKLQIHESEIEPLAVQYDDLQK